MNIHRDSLDAFQLGIVCRIGICGVYDSSSDCECGGGLFELILWGAIFGIKEEHHQLLLGVHSGIFGGRRLLA